jgi:protein gp37
VENSEIQWTDHTFNPWIGCTKVSPACLNCYAENLMDKRYGRVEWGAGKPRQRTSKENWRKPIQWNNKAGILGIRQRVFCASLADVFDSGAPDEWRTDLWQLIERTPNLDWLLLTKRPENISGMVPWQTWQPNIWLGTSVENQKYADIRLPILSQLPAVKFISAEPLLGEISLDGFDIDWCIVGGESGANWRAMDLNHVRSLRDQCTARGIAFFFKQHSNFNPKSLGRDLDGREWNEFPTPRALNETDATAEPAIRINSETPNGRR